MIWILFVSPAWGVISTALFLQIWLGLANSAIGLVGFVRGKVSRRHNAIVMGGGLVAAIAFSGLLHTGEWAITRYLLLGPADVQNFLYWGCAAITALGIAWETPGKLHVIWRRSNVVGAFEADVAAIRAGAARG